MHDEEFLIATAGPEHPDLCERLAALLANHDLPVHRIWQETRPGQTEIGALVRVAPGTDRDRLAREVSEQARRIGHVARVMAVGSTRSARVGERWVATLLTPVLDADRVGATAQLLKAHGLRIVGVRTLSDRDPVADPGRGAAVEYSLVGSPPSFGPLRAEAMALATEGHCDLVVQRDGPHRRTPELAVFDMDSTLIRAEVIDELARARGIGSRVAEITERAMRGEIDFARSFRERLALLEGLPASRLAAIADDLELSPGAERLIGHLRRIGVRTAILSGGFDYFARRIQARLGIDEVHANVLDIENGRVTGRVRGEIVDGNRKVALLELLAARNDVPLERTIAVGDGANDLPMLRRAGRGIAWRAKPAVRRGADLPISMLGLDSVLYVLGWSDSEVDERSA